MVMHACSAPPSLEAQLCFVSTETIKSLGYNTGKYLRARAAVCNMFENLNIIDSAWYSNRIHCGRF